MKRIALFSILILIILGNSACDAKAKKTAESSIEVSDKIEIFYFHYSRRCITCNAVEDVTKETIAALYPEQVNSNAITFTSVNLDESSSKAIAERCKVGGQALVLIAKGQRIDLTDKGFMYAKNQPEILKAEIKKAIDPLL